MTTKNFGVRDGRQLFYPKFRLACVHFCTHAYGSRVWVGAGAQMSPAQVVKEWWGEPLKRRLALLTASLVAFITFLHFAEVAEPYWIAHKQFVRDEIAGLERRLDLSQKDMTGQILELKISNREDARASAQGQVDRIEAELAKLAEQGNETLRQILVEQLARYKRRIEIIDFDMDRLRRERGGRRP